MTMFQEKPVAVSKVKFTGGAKEIQVDSPTIDQIVSVTLDGRVSGVSYTVNEQTGDLEEVVSIRVIEVEGVRAETFPNLVSLDGRRVDPETGEIAADG